MSRHPLTKWAQRSDKLYITVDLPDAKDVKLSLQPDGHFNFSATSAAGNVPYEIDLELYDSVLVDESKIAIGPRNVVYIVKKAEKKWWSRLVKQEGKAPNFLKVDWDKWIDEDEENKLGGDDTDFGGMDFSNLGAGAAGDDFDGDALENDEDDDDEDIEHETTEEPKAEPNTVTEEVEEAKA